MIKMFVLGTYASNITLICKNHRKNNTNNVMICKRLLSYCNLTKCTTP